MDMDAFFASLEERDNPQFKGLPIAVGAEPKNGNGRGVVSTANYKAREYGIHSALPISQAWRLSEEAKKHKKPGVIFLPPDFERYQKASDEVLEIVRRYSESVEQGSIDEFYFDLTSAKNFKKAESVCQKIKQEIKEKIQVTCSVGIGPNKLISKIAAGTKKPDGLLTVKPSNAEDFLQSLPVRKIPGIGPKTESLLFKIGITTVKGLKKLSKNEFKAMLGKWGEDIYYKIKGVDNSPIVENREAKSIGEQITFQKDTLNSVLVVGEFEKLCRGVFFKFKESNFKSFRAITVTVRFDDFETKTSSATFSKGEDDVKKFNIEALKLLLSFFDRRKNPHRKLIRLVGVRMEKLEN